MNVGGVQIDEAVANAFLGAVQPAGLAASLRAAERSQADHDGALAQWRLAVERADYEVQRAERRYRAVDPDNRLVARGLETRMGAEPAAPSSRHVASSRAASSFSHNS